MLAAVCQGHRLSEGSWWLIKQASSWSARKLECKCGLPESPSRQVVDTDPPQPLLIPTAEAPATPRKTQGGPKDG